MKSKIYVCYHKKAYVLKNSILEPIQVGKAGSLTMLPMIGDDTNENISSRNANFCELTAMYWAWKNDKSSEYIGLMHYRRFLNFNENVKRQSDNHGIHAAGFYPGFEKDYGLTPDVITDYLRKYDIILPRPFDAKSIGFKNVYQMYVNAEHHFGADLDAIGLLIGKLAPSYSAYFEKVMKGRYFHTTNIFVMRRDLFDRYCEWLFGLLLEFDKVKDLDDYTPQAARIYGYLSERLFDVWFLHEISNLPHLRIKELVPVMVHDTTESNELCEISESHRLVSVAVATDLNFVDHVFALINSLLVNFNFENNDLEIIVLDGGIGTAEQRLLAELLVGYDRAKIYFIYMKHAFSDLHLRPPFTKETFYRIALPELLYNRDRVLYLDADMIVNTDVSELFNIELGNAYIAAAKDYINIAFQRLKIPSDIGSGGFSADVYARTILNLGDNSEDYFQAGVILFDLKKIRSTNLVLEMIDGLKDFKFWFLDQDVLNKFFKGKVKFISQNWNNVYIDDELINALSAVEKLELEDAKNTPKIVHFAGFSKPWLNDVHPSGWLYWKNLRDTPKYEPRLKSYIGGLSISNVNLADHAGPSILYRVLRKIYRSTPRFIRIFLPSKFTYFIASKLR